MRKELQRDEGLARLSRGTRWLTAGAVLSAGCLSAAVAETLPGRSSAAIPAPGGPSTHADTPATVAPAGTAPPTTAAPASDGDTDTDDGGSAAPAAAVPQTLAPPTTPPTTSYNPPVVSSGGS